MIVVDPSALIAILLKEEDARRYTSALEDASMSLIASASYVELCAVMSKRRPSKSLAAVDEILAEMNVVIEPFTPEQARMARDAYVRYGVLNFGDVFSYALAKEKGYPLLFKGDDFAQTDIEAAA
ncbi:MAG: type II toxin-antitoxin system VapC family toxin [Bacteroidota bacterium]